MSDAQVSTLETLIDIITETAAPEQIILFGSRARCAPDPESDYDLLVVVSDVQNERQVSRRIYRALLEHGIAVAADIVVVDRETLERHRDTPGMIYRKALTEGEIAYDRARV
jgi:predicted nucleotidyltransferase